MEVPESSLRERKKTITRATIIAAAERLFEERGFDEVTVAEIADAANISVKTLFVYFRSKEELVFADTGFIDSIIAALANRGPGQSVEEVIVRVITEELDPSEDNAGVQGFHRGFGTSASLQAGLRRMWSQYEDAVVAELAREAASEPTPQMRLDAIRGIGILRTLTSGEVAGAIAGLAQKEAVAYLEGWLGSVAT